MFSDQYNKMRKTLEKYLDHDRFVHTLGVANTAVSLAMVYDTDLGRAYTAGLLHDCAKCIPNKERLKLCAKWDIPVKKLEEKNLGLLHGKMGAYLAREKYKVDDEEILSAIACHTVGKPDMTMLEKILFVSDYIEPNRDRAENLLYIRKTAFHDIDFAVLLITEGKLDYLKRSGRGEIDPETEEVHRFYQKLREGK